MKDFKSLVGEIKAAAESIIAEIGEIDRQIEAAQNQRDALTEAKVSKKDYLEFVAESFRRRGREFEQGICKLVEKSGMEYGYLDRTLANFGALNTTFLTHNVMHEPYGDLSSPAVYFYFGDLMLERLETALEGVKWPDDAVPVAERVQLIAQLDAEVAELTQRRDGMIEQLQAAGISG